MYITLAPISLLRESTNHDRTMVLHLHQELNKGEDRPGMGIKPFTNPNLFLALKAKNTNLAQLG